MSARIVLTRPLPAVAAEMLADAGEMIAPQSTEPLTADALRSLVRGADAIVSQLYDQIDAAVMDAAGPQLRIVANVASGHNNIDVAAAQRRNIAVTNTPGVLTDATADLAIALMLMVMRRLGEGERLLRRRQPWSWDLEFMLGASLHGRRLGIVGYGQIGRAVATRARAFGMQVIRSARAGADVAGAGRWGVEDGVPAFELDDLLREADVVSLHCPLTPQTRHLMDKRRFAMMRPGSFLVNTARGPIVDEAALVAALRDGPLAGAALDVFEHEPAVTLELLELEQVVISPHLGSATHDVRNAMAELAATNVVACVAGRPLLTPVKVPSAMGTER